MTEDTIKKLTTENLGKQKKAKKGMFWILFGLTVLLLFFPMNVIIKGGEFEIFDFIMPTLTLITALMEWNTIRKINKELANRNL